MLEKLNSNLHDFQIFESVSSLTSKQIYVDRREHTTKNIYIGGTS